MYTCGVENRVQIPARFITLTYAQIPLRYESFTLPPPLPQLQAE